MARSGSRKKQGDGGLPTPAVDVLQRLFQKSNTPLAQDFKRFRLGLDWTQVVGENIASKCTPVGFSNGILYIWVVNATWMNQLFYARQDLLKKIQGYFKDKTIRMIRFTQNRADVPKAARWPEGQPSAQI